MNVKRKVVRLILAWELKSQAKTEKESKSK